MIKTPQKVPPTVDTSPTEVSIQAEEKIVIHGDISYQVAIELLRNLFICLLCFETIFLGVVTFVVYKSDNATPQTPHFYGWGITISLLSIAACYLIRSAVNRYNWFKLGLGILVWIGGFVTIFLFSHHFPGFILAAHASVGTILIIDGGRKLVLIARKKGVLSPGLKVEKK